MVLLFLKEDSLFRVRVLSFPILQPCEVFPCHARVDIEGRIFPSGRLAQRLRSWGLLYCRLLLYRLLIELLDLFDCWRDLVNLTTVGLDVYLLHDGTKRRK